MPRPLHVLRRCRHVRFDHCPLVLSGRRMAHQFVERHRRVDGLRSLQHPGGHVVLEREVLELAEAFAIRQVPVDHLLRTLVALRHLLDQLADLVGTRLQPVRAHEFAQQQPEPHPALGLRREEVHRQRRVLRSDAAGHHVVPRHLRQSLLFGLDQRFRHLERRDGQQAAHHAVLGPRAQARSDFTLEVAADLRAHLPEVAVGDAERPGELRVERRQHGLLHLLQARLRTARSCRPVPWRCNPPGRSAGTSSSRPASCRGSRLRTREASVPAPGQTENRKPNRHRTACRPACP